VGLNPPVNIVAPRGTVQFIASGGSGTGYLFSLVTSSSGATIDATTGLYQAGAIPNVSDIVGVVDSLGKAATAEVMVGADVTLSTTTEALAPMGVLTLNVSGGSGAGYQFVLTTNGSGGSIDPVTGNYQAGPTGNTTDVVTVTDTLGNSVTVTITVGQVLALAAADRAVPPRGSLALAATGGATPYRFAFAANASGGTIDSWTGQYVAGAIPSVKDMVKVIDDNDVVVSLSITVGPGVSITPAAPRVAAGGTVQLTAAGGAGAGYSWRIADGSAKGGVDPTTGLYTASRTSPSGTADIVEASDPLGNTARVTIDRKVASVSASGGSSGCSCDTTSPGPWGSRALVLGAVGLVVLTMRRRRGTRLR
jgi:MYXO-CTERM domain-containing protein